MQDDVERESAASWVVSLRSIGTQRPLFCACAGRGDVFEYRAFASSLPKDLPIYAFGIPPLLTGNPIPTVEELAAVYLQKVRELQSHGPYRLCGHSFGGLVVFQMALLLEREGEEVDLLALLDTLNPAHKHALTDRERAEFRRTYLFSRFGRYARNLATGRLDKVLSEVCFFLGTFIKRTFWKTVRSTFTKLGHPIPEAIRSDAMILTAAWHAYVPADRYNGKIVLVASADRPPEHEVDPSLGWRPYAADLEICVVPGNHYSMLQPPRVEVLVERLMAYLTH